ncbi:MAG: hypothetical protein ACM3ZA_01900, partial [Bacillota bacterium]
MDRGSEPVREGNRKAVTVAEVEALIGGLGGVSATRVVVNDWGGVEEVHVLATLERGPKQIVRDIESALAARFGLMLDRKKISVAQLIGLDPTLPEERLKLTLIEASTDLEAGLQRISVTLAVDEEDGPRYQATRKGAAGYPQALRLAGEAVLTAVNEAIDPEYLFALENVDLITQGQRRVALATCMVVGPRQEEEDVLAGAAVSKGDDIDTVVRACLDAVNRRYSRLPRRKRVRGQGPAAGASAAATAPDEV